MCSNYLPDRLTASSERQPEKSTASRLSSISRRGFFALAAALGLTAATGGLEGMFVRAWADETTGAASYKIYVVKRWELPVSFLDMTDPGNPRSIAGAHISITSHCNQKSVEATTDELGIAIIDITELADPNLADIGADIDAYAFYGSALVECAGYRTFETGKLYLRGGQQLDAPTEPLNGRPYVRCATIDGWDIQYAKSATFVSTPANTLEHEVVVKLADGSGRAAIALGQEGGASISGTAQFEGGIATCAMKARLFSASAQDASVAMQPGKDILLDVQLDDAPADSFTLITNAAVMKGERDDEGIETDAPFSIIGFFAGSGADEGVSLLAEGGSEGEGAADGQLPMLSEILPTPGFLTFPLPDDVPLIGGNNLTVSSIIPDIPVTYTIDPFGLFVLGAGCATKFHRQENDWMSDTLENSLQSYESTRQKWREDFADWKAHEGLRDLFGGKSSKVGSFPMTKDFNLSFQAGGMLMLQWGDRLAESGKSFEGDLQVYAMLSGSATFTKQFVASGVPFFLRAELAASARFTIDQGLAVKGGTMVPSSNTGFSVAIKPYVAFTAALGVADLLSVGVRGLGYFNFYLGFPAHVPANSELPHFTIGAGVSASVAIQVVLFKANVEVYAYDKPDLYDSWGGSAALQSANSAGKGPSHTHSAYLIDGGYLLSADSQGLQLQAGVNDVPASALAQTAVPVSETSLLKSAEFSARRKAEPLVLLQGEDAAADGAADADEALHDLYEYTPAKGAGDSDHTTLLAMPGTPLQSLGAEGALMAGGLVHADVFSDPRMKIVSVKGVPWMIRILTVSYEISGSSQARTRLSVSKWSESSARWEQPQVIDFAPTYPSGTNTSLAPTREDLYDYDFAALSASDVANLEDGDMWQDGSLVRVFLISGTREGSAAGSMGAALSRTVGTFLGIGQKSDGTIVVRKALSFLDVYDRVPDTAQNAASSATFTCSTLTHPCIVSTQDSFGTNVTAVFAFCRAAATPEALVSGPYEEKPATALFTSQGLSLVGNNPFCYVSPGQAGMTDDFRAMITDVKHTVSVGILSSKVYEANQFIIGCHYTTVNASGEGTLKSFAIVRNTNVGSATQNDTGEAWLIGENPGVRFAYPWKAAGAASALCCTGAGLSTASFTLGSNGAPTGVTLTDVSLDKGIDLSSFALNENTGMLYYTTAREGNVPKVAEDGSAGQSEAVADYRIWASHYAKIGGEQGFIKPFALIQTSDAIDSLAVSNFDDSYGFVTNSLVSLDQSLSNIMFYRLPFIRSARLLDFASEHEFVCAGAKEPFLITVRNDGNVAISSFTIAITAEGMTEQRIKLDLTDTANVEPLVGVQDVSDKAEATAASAGGIEYRVPEFSLAVKAGILNPGETRSFRFTWLVPEAFHGITELDVVVVNEGGDAPGAAGTEGSFKLHSNASSLGVLGAQFAHQPVKSAAEFRAQATSEAADGDDTWATKSRYLYANENEPGPAPKPKPESGPGENPVEIAPSGDGLSNAVATAALLAGLGAAGAGVAVHHLQQNESE